MTKARLRPMRSPSLPPIRMNAADTRASSAIAPCTPLTVVSRSWTTLAIDTFISDVSTTSTNIAIASITARRVLSSGRSAASPVTPVTPVAPVARGMGSRAPPVASRDGGPAAKDARIPAPLTPAPLSGACAWRMLRPMAATAPPPATTDAPTWHVLSRESAVEELHVSPERGLTSEEVAERVARYGPNRFAEAKTEPRWRAFMRQYQDPIQIVLVAAG